MNITMNTLHQALSKYFNKEIVGADSSTVKLHGGTVGNVSLVTGTAETADGQKLPYQVVLKISSKWERYNDPNSWRREYDLYQSELETTFSDTLRWPTCYHAEMNAEETEFQLWLEYIDGVSGLELSGDMYEQAALELGRYQGKLYAEQPEVLQRLNNLSHADLMKNTYLHYRSWPLVYDYIRSEACDFPPHIRQMLIDIDENSDAIFARIERLPLVLNHRDFWVTNIFYADGKINLIDWDTSGWGYFGEDLASLIADEADMDHMVEYYQRCVPAYYKGFAAYAEAPPLDEHCVYEMILIVFGYRMVENYLHADSDEEKEQQTRTLQKIYEIKGSPLHG
ncbi:phosphotransferase [Paenibacillus silvae]|uniref:phosphotransferase n=1 Tax=Paenibacillus silvae TaxID=1325358 RepID=UPI0020066A6C|nr:phosphotransferase [Paenibacillus silvae]MCK6076755.1 aminoglycoside phosphotransferase family protein [Paenibacillus silvae]MCK6151182.1 aminoglycoside phosphotransferase family protein [Paenibacillus silvae]MCK6269441.1 aminoglycoside phosphotransferase family protein [Paenibacillus silvae]